MTESKTNVATTITVIAKKILALKDKFALKFVLSLNF